MARIRLAVPSWPRNAPSYSPAGSPKDTVPPFVRLKYIYQIAQLPGDCRLRERLGENGCRHVRRNFPRMRHVRDYPLTVLELEHPCESVVYLAQSQARRSVRPLLLRPGETLSAGRAAPGRRRCG